MRALTTRARRRCYIARAARAGMITMQLVTFRANGTTDVTDLAPPRPARQQDFIAAGLRPQRGSRPTEVAT